MQKIVTRYVYLRGLKPGFDKNRAYNRGIGPEALTRRIAMAEKREVLLTTRVLTMIRVAKEMARDEAAKGVLVNRSTREDAIANRMLSRMDTDYFPGCFGPHLKDEKGKNVGQGEWTNGLKNLLKEAYLDEKALILVETPAVPDSDEKIGFVGPSGYVNGYYADYLNEWAVKRVAERSLKASV